MPAIYILPVVCTLLAVKRYLPLLIRSAANASLAGGVTNHSAEALLTLRCPITMRRITLPARGHGCEHIQVNSWIAFTLYRCCSWHGLILADTVLKSLI
jgi:MIZ/SP-RING zinc finger